MKPIACLLLLSLMFCMIKSDALQTIVHTFSSYPEAKNWRRVTKLQPVTFGFLLANTPSSFLEFPGLTMTF